MSKKQKPNAGGGKKNDGISDLPPYRNEKYEY